MPIYEIDGPDGKTYEIEGPPGATREQVIERVKASLGPAQPKADTGKPNPIVDSIRNAPGAVARGGAAIAGLPGDINDLMDSGANWVMSKATGKPVDVSTRGSLPNSSGINKAVSEPFGGYYKPQTQLGKYSGAALEFLPAAIGGGGGLVAKAARVLIPSAASETAGQLTEGTPYEPLARAAGALVGGMGVGGAEALINSRKNPTISLADLGKAKAATYKAAEQAGVSIAPTSWQTFAAGVRQKLSQKPFRDDLHPNAVAALKTIEGEKGAVTLENADAIRQVVKDAIEAGYKNNGGDGSRAKEIKILLDDFLDNLSPADTVSGDASVAVPLLKEARGLAQREFKAKEIQQLIDLAENSASSNYSASGMEQALRVQFKNFNAKLIKDPGLANSFTKAEREAIKRVAEGGPVGNVLRYFGKLAPTGVVSGGLGSGIGAGIGAAVGGVPGAMIGGAVAPVIGGASRAGASYATSRNARIAEELMRAGPGSALQNPAKSAANPALIDALLGFQGAHR